MKKLMSMVLVLVLCLSISAPGVTYAATIKLNKSKLEIGVGDTYTLKLTGTKGTIKWTSSDESVASVSKKGKVTALVKGNTTITAKCKSKKYQCTVKVGDPLVTIISSGLMELNDEFSEFISTMDLKEPTVNEDGTITYKMTEAQQKSLLTFLKDYGTQLLTEELNSNETTTSCKSFNMSEDVTSFEFYVDKSKYTIFNQEDFTTWDSMLVAVMMISVIYQEYAGVNEDDMRCILHVYDYETKDEIETIDTNDFDN